VATAESLPVYLRVGDLPERQIGTVNASDHDTGGGFVAGVAQLLHTAADQLGEQTAREQQQSPHDRQVRTPGRNR